ncbi:MAG: IS1634 family transposase [Bacteroidota bacterium]|nr:IS1634 family transposase [Bacteroidota bacterium]
MTTFYFDSEIEQPGALRQMGFSKDGKIGKTQVVFALLVDSNKNPLGYRVYCGNYFEGHTFKDMVAQLRQEYCIKQVVIVADRGMMSRANLQLFEEEQLGAGYQFIAGERLKNLSERAKAYLTDLKNYTTVCWKNDDGNEITLRYCTYQFTTKTLIGSYSQSRAEKDKFDRQQRITKAEHLLKQPSQLHKKAARYFLKRTGEATYELDKEKIAQAERYDGFMVIATNATALSPEQVLEKYKDLYQIEQTFRTFKSYLETRPMFHWTDQRICGHLCMCYISFCLLNYLQQRLRAQNIVSSEQAIRRMLVKMQLSKLEQNGNTIYLRSSLDEHTKTMLTAIGLKPPPDMFAEDRITNYL